MDWLPTVSLTVGIASIAVAIASIWLSVTTHSNTKDVLAAIDKRAAVIDETVKGTQQKLVETLTNIASPPKPSPEETLMTTLLPLVAANPELLERLSAMGQKAQENSPNDPLP